MSEVQPLRQLQGPRDAQPDHERAQAFPAIEFIILRGVDQIEARHPADHAEAEDERRQIEPPGLRDPGAGGRDGEGEPEEEMGRVGEAFRERVEEDDRQGDGREKRGEPVDRRRGAR